MLIRVTLFCRFLLAVALLLAQQVLANNTVTGSIPAEFSINGGSVNYSIPIQVTQGRGGMQPDLSLNYSGGGNGILGVGWSLGGLSTIHRCSANLEQDGFVAGINFTDKDRYCLDGQRLIPVNGVNGGVGTEYKTEVDGYSQIKSYGGATNNPGYWVAKTKAGQVITFGDDSGSTSNASLSFSQGTTSWSVKEINDTTGNNPITYTYSNHQNTQYLEEVNYINGKVDLSYSNRSDTIQRYFLGHALVQDKLLTEINVYSGAQKIKTYTAEYENDGAISRTRLNHIVLCNELDCLQPINFAWTQHDSNSAFQSALNIPIASGRYLGHSNGTQRLHLGDFNGDGLTDLLNVADPLSSAGYNNLYLANGNGFNAAISVSATHHLGHSNGTQRVHIADFNGDGMDDILNLGDPPGDSGYNNLYLANGSGFDAAIRVAATHHLGHSNGTQRVHIADFNGDGMTDIVNVGDLPGNSGYNNLYLANGSGFDAAIQFGPAANQHLGHSNKTQRLHVADFNGDGMADLLNLGDNANNSSGHNNLYLANGSGFDAAIPVGATHHLGHSNNTQRVHIADFNGDGMADILNVGDPLSSAGYNNLYLANGNGFDGAISVSATHHLGHSNGTQRVHIADFNGDGMADILNVGDPAGDSGYNNVYFANGAGFNAAIRVAATHHLGHSNGTQRVHIADFNSDGMADILNVGDQLSSAGYNNLYLANGNGFDGAISVSATHHLGHSNGTQRVHIADFDGDGMPDLLNVGDTPGNSIYNNLYLNKNNFEHIISITDSSSNITSLSYKPLTDSSVYTKGTGAQYPVVDLQYPQYVVSSVESSNGVGGTTTVNYQYESLKAHVRGRGSYGFGKITETYPDTGKTLETYTNQSAFPYVGLVDRVVETFFDNNGNGQVVNESDKTYSTTNSGGVHTVYLSNSVDKSYELNGSLITTVTTQNSNVDAYGNVGTVTVTTTGDNPVSGSSETFVKTTQSTYTNDSVNWYLGRLTESTVTHSAPGQSDQQRRSSFTYDNTTGLLTTEAVVSTSTNQPLTTTTYQYDPYGQKTQVTISAANETDRITTTAYNTEGRPTQTCNALNECETYTYTPEGWLQTTTGPNSISTTWEYDGFGRKTKETRADGTETTIAHHFANPASGTGQCGSLANHAYTCLISQTTGSQPVTVQYDRLGREVRKIATGFDGRLIYSDTEYNHLAQVSRVSRDYFMGDHMYWANSQYDALNRVVHMDEPAPHGSRNSIHTTYNGLITTVTSGPESRQKVAYTNVIGQVVRREEEEGSTIDYTYSADGNLKTTTVADNTDTTISLSYDEFGRKVGMDDPDMGVWSYSYNAFGQLISQTDAKNQTTTMAYDVLGRMTSRTDLAGTANAATSTWTYGDNTAPQGSIGKLLSETANGMTKTYYYDNLGRPDETNTTIDPGLPEEQSFTAQTLYDSIGRVSRTIYPGSDNFYTENLYNANGFLESVRGLRSAAEQYDLSQLTPLVTEAVTLAASYNEKAVELQQIGTHYKHRIDYFKSLLANQYIDFQSGDIADLSQGKGYDYLSAGDGKTFYILVENNYPFSIGGITIPQKIRANFHYKVEFTLEQQVVTKITNTEFSALEANLLSTSKQVYALSDTRMSCACDGDNLGQTYVNNVNLLIQQKADKDIIFEQGTVAELREGVQYDYYAAGDDKTFYIKMPDVTQNFYLGGISIPHVAPSSFHYKVTHTFEEQTVERVPASEFTNQLANLAQVNGSIVKIAGNRINCLCDGWEVEYTSQLTAHQQSLESSVLQGQTMTADFLGHLNNTIIELQTVVELIDRQTEGYAATSEQLILLAEQTLAAADNSFQYERTLSYGATAYTELINEDAQYTTYWKALDVDASGRISAEVYGNGIVNDYTYNQGTGQLQHIHSGLLTINPIRHLEYEYDAYQNVTVREDHANDIRETFEYDRLDRLTRTDITSSTYTSAAFNGSQTQTYDVLGNITHKSDVGAYTYGGSSQGNAGPHAVTQTAGTVNATYIYDANGNMTAGDGRTVQWSSFNKPTLITKGTSSAEFFYGADRARYKKVNHQGDTTLYVGKLYEHKTYGTSQATEEKHYIFAMGQMVAEHIVSSQHGVQTRYLHKDALGSIDLITDGHANVVDRRSFDAWGKLRNLTWQNTQGINDPLYLTQLPFTDRGYTGHEHIQEVGLIHMNGRVYDATLARFMSADPHIQEGALTQSYNRYSYVMNNPLKYTDPSGYFFKKLFRAIKRVIKRVVKVIKKVALAPIKLAKKALQEIAKVPILNAIVGAAACFFGGPLGCAAFSAASTYAVTGSLSAGLKAGLAGLVSGAGMGGGVLTAGLASGVASVIQGGKFGDGFRSGFIGSALGGTIKGFAQKIPIGNSMVARTIKGVIAGGTLAELGGGKFKNGAVSAAGNQIFAEFNTASVASGRESSSQGNGKTAGGGAFDGFTDYVDGEEVIISSDEELFPIDLETGEILLASKGGKQNISAGGFNRNSSPLDVQKAMDEAKSNGNNKHYRKLKGLLKVIKRGGKVIGPVIPLPPGAIEAITNGDKMPTYDIDTKEGFEACIAAKLCA